jgi:penicillin-binding protein 1A
MVCLKSADKSDEEIIKSFSVKQNDRVYMERRKGHYYDSMDSIRYYKHFLQSGLMAMEPQTGNIKAWVGGIDYKYFQYDHVGQGARQVGSTFKPFVYATAIEQLNMSPCDSIIDALTMPLGATTLLKHGPQETRITYIGMVTLKKH